MSRFQERLRTVADEASALALTAPDAPSSQIRSNAHRLAQATRRMERVTAASLRSIPTLELSRFSTAAEDVLSTLRSLAKLVGRGSDADVSDPETEATITGIVDVLCGAADAARDAAVRALRETTATTAELTYGWKAKLSEGAIRVARSNDLSDVFLCAPSPEIETVTDMTVPEGKTRRFLKKLTRPHTAREEKMTSRIAVSDAVLDRLMASEPYSFDKKSCDTRNLLEYRRTPKPLENVCLQERGLIAEHHQCTLSFKIRSEPPQVMTPVWERVAEEMCGDPANLRKALSLRDDPEFLADLKSEVVHKLAHLAEQAVAGSPGPHASFSDPVLSAAILSTLMAPRLKWFQDSMNARGFDPFGLGFRFEALRTANPGLDIKPIPNGLALATCASAVSPTGIAEHLHASVRNFKAQTFNLRYGIIQGIEVNLSDEAGKRPDAETGLVVATYLYMEEGRWEGLKARVHGKVRATRIGPENFRIQAA